MSNIENVSNYFDRAAVSFDSLYDENRKGVFWRFINRHFRNDIYERFELSIKHASGSGAKSVLDVGCGSGVYGPALVEQGVEKIVGIDTSAKMLELAREKVKSVENHDKIFEFICSDFAKYQTKDTFNMVLAMGFFDYIDDPVSVLKKMRVLSDNTVVASFPSKSFYRTPIRKIRYFIKRCPLYFYDSQDIEDLSKKAGFSKVEITKIKGAGMDYFTVFTK